MYSYLRLIIFKCHEARIVTNALRVFEQRAEKELLKRFYATFN